METPAWTAFRSHWDIEPFYCCPGLTGAHEKGGVEGKIGYFRRNHFVLVPEVASLAELNELVDAWDLADESRRIRQHTNTVGQHFEREKERVRPLPADRSKPDAGSPRGSTSTAGSR
ncbi:hypothetical protein [Streptomyces sp. NPDC056468]|uniref:hypothetical protein n=1 Tax=Streptomyces sp. NPDC056468 TaxID=3345830 RepID=UPI0036C59F6D